MAFIIGATCPFPPAISDAIEVVEFDVNIFSLA
jgi:hypothetical protein